MRAWAVVTGGEKRDARSGALTDRATKQRRANGLVYRPNTTSSTAPTVQAENVTSLQRPHGSCPYELRLCTFCFFYENIYTKKNKKTTKKSKTTKNKNVSKKHFKKTHVKIMLLLLYRTTYITTVLCYQYHINKKKESPGLRQL